MQGAPMAAMAAAGVAVPHHFENRYVSRDGGVHWISWISVPGADGLVYGVGRDITERRRAEQALRDSEEQYRAIFNASADALVLRAAGTESLPRGCRVRVRLVV